LHQDCALSIAFSTQHENNVQRPHTAQEIWAVATTVLIPIKAAVSVAEKKLALGATSESLIHQRRMGQIRLDQFQTRIR
jgi:hypothetical protein